ncbi:SCO6880 family protein [Streptomyces sp. NPDC088360]|uniref:SCO6880 family protein n=1 Tax=Streptomyces sp. NPDC088360 TaxID=3154515 RepID=UPI003450C5A6
MSATTHEAPAVLTVDGFRTRRSFGLGNLSKSATITLTAVLCADGIIAAGAPGTLLLTLPLTLAVAALAAMRRHGMPALAYYWARMSWRRARRHGVTTYRRLLLPQPYALDLPGVAASSTLIRAYDPTSGSAVGVVHGRGTDLMSVTTLLAPGGSLMAPTSAVSGAVRTWGDVLAGMSTDEQIKGASVTIQITPGAGEALADDVKKRKDPGSPKLARQTIDELVGTTPHATASVAAWMTVTVDPNATDTPPADLAEQVGETLRVVDSLDLSGTGTDVHRRATDVDLRRLVRSAYDPNVFHEHPDHFVDLSWGECGPVAADDGWTEFAHDEAVSVSQVLQEMPRRAIPYSILLPLLSPGRFQRRITLSYRVLDPFEGEAVLEREISNAEQRADATAQVKGRAKFSQKADYARAEKAAAAAASGAQVVDWTLTVTTTAPRLDDLIAARQELTRAVKATRGIRMRPAYGAQGPAFAVGLPVGYNPLVRS